MRTLNFNSQAKYDTFLAKLEREKARLISAGEWVDLDTVSAPQWTCENCHDIGTLIVNEQRRYCQECARGREMEWAMYNRLLSDSQLPDYYQNLTLNTWAQLPADERAGKELAYAAALAFVDAAPTKAYLYRSLLYQAARLPYDGREHVATSLVFQSDVGYGKTGLAAGIVHALAARGVVVAYTRTQALIQDVLKTYQADYEGPSRQDIVSRVKSARVLVLDEFNLSNVSEHTEDVLQEIIRHRHGYALPTVITCNWTQEGLRAGWGNWIADVLLEMSHWIPLGGAKLRQASPVNTIPARTQHLREVRS